METNRKKMSARVGKVFRKYMQKTESSPKTCYPAKSIGNVHANYKTLSGSSNNDKSPAIFVAGGRRIDKKVSRAFMAVTNKRKK